MNKEIASLPPAVLKELIDFASTGSNEQCFVYFDREQRKAGMYIDPDYGGTENEFSLETLENNPKRFIPMGGADPCYDHKTMAIFTRSLPPVATVIAWNKRCKAASLSPRFAT